MQKINPTYGKARSCLNQVTSAINYYRPSNHISCMKRMPPGVKLIVDTVVVGASIQGLELVTGISLLGGLMSVCTGVRNTLSAMVTTPSQVPLASSVPEIHDDNNCEFVGTLNTAPICNKYVKCLTGLSDEDVEEFCNTILQEKALVREYFNKPTK